MIALNHFNQLSGEEAVSLLAPCVAVPGWAAALAAGRPWRSRADLLNAAQRLMAAWGEAELAEALSENETAEKIFAALPSSHQNEYLRWIGEAKRAETRQRRAAKAVEMLVDKHG